MGLAFRAARALRVRGGCVVYPAVLPEQISRLVIQVDYEIEKSRLLYRRFVQTDDR